jgi:thioredoxin
MKMVENLTKETFKDKIFNYEKNKDWKYEGDIPAIVDFYADWCGPCKMIAPILDELAEEYKGKINIYKINTEEEKELAGMFDIMSIPTLLFIPTDGEPRMARGALQKQEFESKISEFLLKKQD